MSEAEEKETEMNVFKKMSRSVPLAILLLLAFAVGSGYGMPEGERKLKAADFSLKNL